MGRGGDAALAGEGVRGPGGPAGVRRSGLGLGRPARGSAVSGHRQEDRGPEVAPERTPRHSRPKTASRGSGEGLRSRAVKLDEYVCDQARLARDARFDGRFFIGVLSTGIYCRPICPSPTAKRANVRYFGSAEEATAAGFRPCLRCRPESAPGTPAWNGTSATVSRALRLIAEGALQDHTVAELSKRLGMSPRHLHRLFLRHLGASPIAVARTRRLQFAK